MKKKLINNVKLGLFVLAGLLFLIVLLYMIGRNRNLFGKSYTLKARFEHVQGLVAGSNVRFAGIQTGTVKKIEIINDTVIEVSMLIDTDMKNIIRKNAIASIGTDGLVGNKVVNIVPSKTPAPLSEDGDLIASKKILSTDAILEVLNRTTNDVAVIAAEMKQTFQRINSSTAVWSLLNDERIPTQLRSSLTNIKTATAKADHFINELNTIIANVKKGQGAAGAILTDTLMAMHLKDAVLKINHVSLAADSITGELYTLISGIRNDVNNGDGTIHSLLKDTALVTKLHMSLTNIQKGTDGFNQNMEALKHHFLFRSYYRKLEKQTKK